MLKAKINQLTKINVYSKDKDGNRAELKFTLCADRIERDHDIITFFRRGFEITRLTEESFDYEVFAA